MLIRLLYLHIFLCIHPVLLQLTNLVRDKASAAQAAEEHRSKRLAARHETITVAHVGG